MINLIENKIDNINILTHIADIVIFALPDVIYENSSFQIIPYTNKSISDKLKALLSEYTDNYKIQEFILHIYGTSFIFKNSKKYVGSDHIANYRPGEINIYLSALVGDVIDLDIKKLIRAKLQNTTIKTILIHELRHLFQYTHYPKYYKDVLSSKLIYRESPIEVDAAWHHIIGSKSPKFYNSPYKYTNDILDEFQVYRDLSKKQYNHYRRLAAKYYYQYKNISTFKFIKKFVDAIDNIRQYENYKDFLTTSLNGFFGVGIDISNLTKDEKEEYALIKKLTKEKYLHNKQQPINESKLQIYNILNDVYIAIEKSLPEIVKSNTVINKFGYNINGIRDIIKKYQNTKYKKSIESILDCNFLFVNKSIKNSNIYGEYYDTTNTIVIYISGLQKSTKAIEKSNLLAIKTVSGKTFEGIVKHELRHVMQHVEYAEYYEKSRLNDYTSSGLEIDAKWFQTISDADEKEFTNSLQYLEFVLNVLSSEKKLTKNHLNHYRKKTLRHYFETYKNL